MSATDSPAMVSAGQARDAAALTEALVRCASVGQGAALEEAFQLLTAFLGRFGIGYEITRPNPEHPVLLAWLESGRAGPRLVFQGHLDVVPPGDNWAGDPFSAHVEAGRLHGRGSCDMKGGVASAAAALAALRAAGLPKRGAVGLLVVPDEEQGSEGGLIPFLADGGLQADWAICAEPTSLLPLLGNRGLMWCRVAVEGRAGHAGMPGEAENPVPVAAELVTELESLPVPAPSRPELPPPSLTVTGVQAGSAVNVIPGRAEVGIDRRVDPSEDHHDALAAISQAVDRVAERHRAVRISLSVDKVWPPCELASDSALAQTALGCARRVRPSAEFGFDQAANDSSFLADAGVPTLLWGPGEPALAHSDRESISVAEIEDAVKAFACAAARLTGEER